jgi:DNA-binding LacI/PurR family transcriptional regulator
VPEDFSIVTFDSPLCVQGESGFTHIRQNEHEMGKHAVDALCRIIQGEDPGSLGDILIPARLISGYSIAPPSFPRFI